MQQIKKEFWRSLASILSVFLVAGLVEAYSIYAEFGEILIPNGAIAARFLLASFAIYFCAGVIVVCLASLMLLALGKIWPFKKQNRLVSVLSISVAAFYAAYLFDYVLQNILGNPLTRIDITLLFLGGILLAWVVSSIVNVLVFGVLFRIQWIGNLLERFGLLRYQIVIIAAYVLVGLIMAPGSGVAPSDTETKLPNVWLISIDTLRADRLSSYGYTKNETPNIDRVASDGVIFDNAFSPDHWTLPAHASLFTSLSPDVHGLNEWESDGFVAEIPKFMDTIASQLLKHGYTTVGAVDNDRLGYLGASRNFNQGFNYYGHYPVVISPYQHLLFSRVTDWLRRPVEHEHTSNMIASILSWLGEGPKPPYFFFLHLYDVHAEFDNKVQFPRYPYYPFRPCVDRLMPDWQSLGPPTLNGAQGEAYMLEVNRLSNAPPFSEGGIHYKGPDQKELELLSATYDCGISLVDEQLGLLFDRLRELGEYDNSVIVLTSDHGEAFYEHEQLGHWTLYDELLRIPLIIKPVDSRDNNRRRSEPVSLLDVAPTIFDLVGAPGFEIAEGLSLVSLISDEPADTPDSDFSNRVLVSGSLEAHKHLSLHNRDHKIIRGLLEYDAAALELYNIKRDRGEKINLAGFEQEILAEYTSMLDQQARDQAQLADTVDEKVGSPGDRVRFTDLMKDNLKALGYVE